MCCDTNQHTSIGRPKAAWDYVLQRRRQQRQHVFIISTNRATGILTHHTSSRTQHVHCAQQQQACIAITSRALAHLQQPRVCLQPTVPTVQRVVPRMSPQRRANALLAVLLRCYYIAVPQQNESICLKYPVLAETTHQCVSIPVGNHVTDPIHSSVKPLLGCVGPPGLANRIICVINDTINWARQCNVLHVMCAICVDHWSRSLCDVMYTRMTSRMSS